MSRRPSSKSETEPKGTFEIPKNAFDSNHMSCGRSIHKLADLINSVGNIRASNSEVLERLFPGELFLLRDTTTTHNLWQLPMAD